MEKICSMKQASKVCEVCGDKAFGFNFNAVSCESCKAFFRRYALKNKGFSCPFSDNCEISPITRRFCQKCRLEKCFTVGMKKEHIMSEEDKVMKKRKIEENKSKKRCVITKDPKTSKQRKIKAANLEFTDRRESISCPSNLNSIESCFSDLGNRPASLGQEEEFGLESSSLASSDTNLSNADNHQIATKNSFDYVCFEDQASSVRQDMFLDCDTSIRSRSDDDRFELPQSINISRCSKESPGGFMMNAPENSTHQSSKLIEDTHLVRDLTMNYNLISRIFQNSEVLFKLFTNTEVLNILMSDPDISKIIKEACENRYENSLNKDELDPEYSTNFQVTDSKAVDHCVHTKEDTKDVLDDVGRISITNEPNADPSLESIVCKAIKLEYTSYSAMSCNQSNKQLSDSEQTKLNELVVANKALLAPLDGEILSIVDNHVGSDPALLDVINLTAVAIRRLIKMSKKISAFKNMCQEDQLALLKGGCTEMMILRSAINYDPNKNLWKIPHSQEKMSKIKVDILKEAKGNLYDELSKFVRTFDPRWRDENVILILSAITLFSPNRPKVIHSDVIKLEQKSYYYLLRRYLESIYPGCEARSMFLKLIQKIAELHNLNNEVVGVYLDVNPLTVEPLLIEIFDLKN